jgi:hypothetical protein
MLRSLALGILGGRRRVLSPPSKLPTFSPLLLPVGSADGTTIRRMGGGPRNEIKGGARHSKHLHIAAREKYILRYTQAFLAKSRRPQSWCRLETLLYHEDFRGWTSRRLLQKIFAKPNNPYELREDASLGIVYVRAPLAASIPTSTTSTADVCLTESRRPSRNAAASPRRLDGRAQKKRTASPQPRLTAATTSTSTSTTSSRRFRREEDGPGVQKETASRRLPTSRHGDRGTPEEGLPVPSSSNHNNNAPAAASRQTKHTKKKNGSPCRRSSN